MSTPSVIVLTVNGRRQNVKVTPNMTIMEILEIVCQKHNFVSTDYDLKHHKRILDVSSMFRFSGLPNNALLEMVEAKTKRVEENVVLCLQLEDGTRLTDSFHPATTLEQIILKLSPNDLQSDTVVIYMRSEVFGEALCTTTMKTLGLSGGRAIFRLIHRRPEELKIQANVSAPLPLRPVEINHNENKNQNRLETKETEVANDEPEKMEVEHNFDTKGYRLNRDNGISPPPDIDTKKFKLEEDRKEKPIPFDESEIVVLGERNAVIFSLNSSTTTVTDLPDSFYDVTVEDIRRLLRDLRNQCTDESEAPLLTAKMRELEENKKILNQLALYKTTVIRIQFPDRHVLQACFKPTDTVGAILEFVRSYIRDPSLEFYLYTTPPKEVLESSLHLIEAHCVPQALLHFGSDKIEDESYEYFKTELYSKLTTVNGANYLAAKCRGKNFNNNIVVENESDLGAVGQSSSTQGSSLDGVVQLSPDNFRTSSTVKSTKLPKWFKTGK